MYKIKTLPYIKGSACGFIYLHFHTADLQRRRKSCRLTDMKSGIRRSRRF